MKRPPLAIRQFSQILLLVIPSCSLRLPCLKFTPVVLIFIKRADRREQKPCKRVKLATLYLRLISRHSPRLCNSLDRFPPCFRLFSCYLPSRSKPCDLNGDVPDFFARDLLSSTSNSSG